MHKRICDDIVKYLDFLTKGEQGSFNIAVSHPFKTLIPFIMENPALSSYLAEDGISSPEIHSLPLKHNLNVMLWVHIGKNNGRIDRDTSAVIANTLGYMLERLFEISEESKELSSMMETYNKALTYIKCNYLSDISVNDVAKELGYSASYFGYIFKKIHGISINHYILEVRLEKAAQLLQSSNHSVSYIAEAVGFSGANYFSTAFKSRFGITPREYRKNMPKD